MDTKVMDLMDTVHMLILVMVGYLAIPRAAMVAMLKDPRDTEVLATLKEPTEAITEEMAMLLPDHTVMETMVIRVVMAILVKVMVKDMVMVQDMAMDMAGQGMLFHTALVTVLDQIMAWVTTNIILVTMIMVTEFTLALLILATPEVLHMVMGTRPILTTTFLTLMAQLPVPFPVFLTTENTGEEPPETLEAVQVLRRAM